MRSPTESPGETDRRWDDDGRGDMDAVGHLLETWGYALLVLIGFVEFIGLPIASIPVLILGGAVQAQTYSRLASQIDLLPTMLGMLGIADAHPATGYDLFRPDIADIPGRAIMTWDSGGMNAPDSLLSLPAGSCVAN